MELLELAEKYADTLIKSEEFQRMLQMKEQIKKTLSGKIMAFKTAEAKYLEAKEYGKYHPDLMKYQKEFVEKKKSLYEEPLIQEYKALERSIQVKLDRDMDDLKQSISNKFNVSKSLFGVL